MNKQFLAVAMCLGMMQLSAQWWTTGNLGTTSPGNFLGTLDNNQLDFRTNNTRYMHMLANPGAQVINGYAGNILNGYVGIGIFNPLGPGNLVSRPHSLLHLNGAGTQDSGYRPWMQTGITMTRQTDQSYFGMKDEGGASNHTVVSWSDNNQGDPGPDLLKFIFVANNVAATGIAGTLDGLEAARFAPDNTGNQTFFGVGDWFTAGVQPTERFDVLDGRVRIRQLPTEVEMDSVIKIVAVNDDGVLGWRTLPTPSTGSGAGCDWTLWNPTTSGPTVPHHVYTAIGSSAICPDDDDHVGIGLVSPAAKLHVVRKPTATDEIGLWVQTTTDGNYSGPSSVAYGVRANIANATGQSSAPVHMGAQGVASNAATANYGLYGSATNTAAMPNTAGCYGVKGDASGTGTNYGVRGYALGGNTAYGVYGSVVGDTANNKYSVYGQFAGNGLNNWTGYFPGRTYSPGGVWTSSDESLKSNIEDLQGAADRLLQLSPKSYIFNVEQYPSMGLPQGQQYGFLAQELETVFPEMVMQTTHPAELDSVGNEVAPAIPFKAVNLNGLTPYLVAAFQEQQQQLAEARATNDALNDQLQQLMDRLDAMEQNVSDCCAAHGALDNSGEEFDEKTLNANDRYLRIAPNPFETRTTVFYQLEKNSRMQLLANSADGKQLQVLQEAEMEAGNYQYEWSTGDLAPGVYYVTLLMDGKPVTKRAVKILR